MKSLIFPFPVIVVGILLAQVDLARSQGKTLVVDATGNGDHKTIGAAVDASSSGDRILIRDGTYKGFRVNSKALRIVGSPGVRIEGNVDVQGVHAGDVVIARATIVGDLKIQDCRGRIVLSLIDNLPRLRSRIVLDKCAAFTASDLRTAGPMTVQNSHGSIIASDLQRVGLALLAFDKPALTLVSSDVVLAGVTIRSNPSQASAVLMQQSKLEVRDDGAHSIEGGPPITGTGEVIVDPEVFWGPFVTTAQAIRGPKWTTRSMAHVGAGSAALGKTMLVLMAKEESEAWALMLGRPGPRVSIAGVQGRLELGVVTGIVAGGAGRSVESVRFTVPNVPALVGAHLGWQGFTIDNGIALTNLSTNVVLAR